MRNVILLAILAVAGAASAESTSGVAISKTAHAVAFTHNINAGEYQTLSFQVDYSSYTPSLISVAGGSLSSVTLNVTDYAALRGQASTATVSILNGKNESLSGTSFTLNGRVFTNGTQWATGTTSTVTARNIAAAVSSWEYFAYASSNVVTIQSVSSGTAANSWTLTSSDATKIAKTGFAAGQAYGYLDIGGTVLTEGTHWYAITSAAATAVSIQTAIMGNSTLNPWSSLRLRWQAAAGLRAWFRSSPAFTASARPTSACRTPPN